MTRRPYLLREEVWAASTILFTAEIAERAERDFESRVLISV
jgi:hypothetical protein